MQRYLTSAIPWLKLVGQSALSPTLRPPTPANLCRRYSIFNSAFRSDAVGELPRDPMRQADWMRQLNRSGQAEAVVATYETGRIAHTEETLGEYIKALVKLERLDNTRLLSTLQRGVEANSPYAARMMEPQMQTPASYFASTAAAAAAGGDSGALGTTKNPLVITQAEPSLLSQVARLIRFLGLAFIAVTAVGAFLDDKAISKSFLNNPNLKPQLVSTTKFDDVKGVDEAKQELEEIVEYLKDPHKFTTLGGKLPKGVLLVGPPGTGKTMLARAIAGEAGVPFFYCSGSEFEEMFVGVGARRVRDLFAAAKKHAPCIVFIDEIDAIGGNRNPKDQMYMRMTLNQLLVELDGFKPTEGVIVVAATNFAEILDKALVRPGRFDRHVMVPRPDVKGRQQILESHFKNIPRAPDVDLSVIARGTPGFSGAELANLVNVAALQAAKTGLKAVNMAALDFARDRILMGAERTSAVVSEHSRKITAYHEGGHALVALLTPGADPVHKATIVPRGMSLGMVTQLPAQDAELNLTARQMRAKLDVYMGGRVAEELIFGPSEVTTGASSDLEGATRIARAMVTKYGMSSKVGIVSLDYNNDDVSNTTRAVVEEEVKQLLEGAYQRARSLLHSHEAELHALARALLENETLSGEQIQAMLREAKESRTRGSAGAPAAG